MGALTCAEAAGTGPGEELVKRTTAAFAALVVIATAACSGDDDAADVTTTPTPPDTTEASTSTSTSMPTTTSTLPPTTAPPPTSAEQAAEALKAQIAADYEAAFYRRYEMVGAPSLDNLEANAAQINVAGSPAYQKFVARIQERVQLGDRVVPNDPDLLSATVELVQLVGGPPYTEAIVTACEVTNRKQVTPPENSPNGQQIEVAGSGALIVIRYEEPVQLTENGWLSYQEPRRGRVFNEGETTCPAP